MNMTIPEPVPRLQGTGWITESWLLFKQNPAAWILGIIAAFMILIIITLVVELIIFIPMGVYSAFSHISSGSPTTPSFSTPYWLYPIMIVIGLGEVFLQMFFYAGFFKMANAAMRRQPVRIEDAFSGWSHTVQLFLYHLPISLISYAIFLPISLSSRAIGASAGSFPWGMYIQLGIGGIVIALLYSFMLPGMALIVDGVSIKDAYVRSFRGVAKEAWPLTLVAIVMAVLYVLAIFTCGLGWFVLVPMWAIIISLLARDACGLPAASEDAYANLWQPSPSGVPGAWPPPPGSWPPAPTATQPLAGPAKPAAPEGPDEPLAELEAVDDSRNPPPGDSS